MKREVPSYNVIIWDVNRSEIKYYDIIPYLLMCWCEEKKRKKKLWNGLDVETTRMPNTFDEFKKFIDKECKYHFWSRCEYEILIGSWPPTDNRIKIDVYEQIKHNIDVVTKILMDYLK